MNSAEEQETSQTLSPLADGALDTLGCIFGTLGNTSFEIGSDTELQRFSEQCFEAVRHIENGSPAPHLEIEEAAAGTRNWQQVRRFYVERRRQEKSFVTDRFQGYRGVVEDLIVGLRDICAQGDATESSVLANLSSIEEAVSNGHITEIKRILEDAILNVNLAFAQQKDHYEQNIRGLQRSMAGLREDLDAAHEEMKFDALTSIYNRGAFDESIARSLNLHFVLNQPISLTMIDVDNFKSINDSYGHSVGDEVLKSVAACLSRAFVRKNDMVARYGGDEFVVLLPDTSAEKAQVSIDRFFSSMQKIRIDGLTDELTISCSAGSTEITHGDTVDTLVTRADAALYEAKQAGRNCLRTR